VTAKDVELTYTLAADKRTSSSVTIAMQAIKGTKEYQDGSAKTVAGIKVIDDNTIQFQLAGPDATFTAFLAGYYGPYIVPYHLLKDVPPDQFDKSDYNTKIPWVGMGPYTVTAGQKDQFLEFTRNDTYFKGKPLIDKFVYRVMQADVALAALQKGEIDLMGQGSGFPAREAANVRANSKLKLMTYPSFLYNALEVNMTKDYLKDPRIHQAILYSLDRKTFVDKVLGGLGEVWDCIIVQPDWVSPNLIKYDYNPEKAKQLLKDANWDPNRVVEWRYYGGFSDYAPFIQQSLTNVGFKINPVSMETATWVKEVVTNGNFDFSVVGGGGITDDPNELYDYFVCDHWSRYCNQTVLDLFDQGRKAVDKTARQKIYFQIEEIINKDAPWMVINSSTSAAAFGARVHPVAYSNYDYLSYHQWWLDQ
jgi:peptide/nickel transport system substrate-binding protein